MSDKVSSGHSFKKWIYGTKALEYLQEGLKDFVGDKAVEYRDNTLRTITNGCTEPIAQCNHCNSQNLLPEHANYQGACRRDPCIQGNPKNCFGSIRNSRRKCPAGICSKLYDAIVFDHRNNDPLWLNTDPTTWCSDGWSIAKCFENYQGPGRSAQGTDVSGLLSIIINNICMQDWLAICYDGEITRHPICKARNMRNDILHKSALELDGQILKDCIDTCISVLTDPKCLLRYKGSKIAVLKLEELRTGNVAITMADEHTLVKLALNAVRDETVLYERPRREKTGSSASLRINAEDMTQVFKTIRSLEIRVEELETQLQKYKTQTDQGQNAPNTEGEQLVIGEVVSVREQKQYEMPTFSRPHDGRLVTLQNKQLEGLLDNCENKVMQGGFGDVKISKDKVRGLDVRVVIKKITCEGDDKIKMMSVSNEKVASRTMHFAIVPLVAYMCRDISGNERGIILHRDLTTKNIVLDGKLNARLIDFGLAREMNEKQTEASCTTCCIVGTRGYFPTVRYSVLTVHEDYYNFGVVIRELLTGREPYKRSGNEYIELRKQSEQSVKKFLQNNIWDDSEEATKLLSLSTKCLEDRGGNITSVDLVEKIKTMCECQWSRVLDDKCDLCMVNDTVKHRHRCSMNVCVSCMRNSHVNPIQCHTCNEEVIPEIGHTYAAILIAGNDTEKEQFAKAFSKEVKEIKDVLASKYPCVVGIREENIHMVFPSNPGQPEELLPLYRSAFASLTLKKNLETLLIYLTGHHFKEKGFQLGGPDDNLTLIQLQEDLNSISIAWGKTPRILAFLDCCYAPSVGSVPDISHGNVKIIQLNAGPHDETISQPISGSHFQKVFIQALTRRVFNKSCHSKLPDCQNCAMSGDFISVEQLLEYISKHMQNCFDGKEPTLYTNGINWQDTHIGYNIDFVVDLSFRFELGLEELRSVSIERDVYCDMKSLKECILQTVIDEYGFSETLRLTSVEFADALALRIQIGSGHGTELNTVLNVSTALDARREIIASYRTASDILQGRVVSFMPTKHISQYLKSNYKHGITEFEQKEVARFTLKELDDITNEMRREFCDMSEEKRKKLDQFREIFVTVHDRWTYGTGHPKSELQVIFPRKTNDEWREYFVMELTD